MGFLQGGIVTQCPRAGFSWLTCLYSPFRSRLIHSVPSSRLAFFYRLSEQLIQQNQQGGQDVKDHHYVTLERADAFDTLMIKPLSKFTEKVRWIDRLRYLAKSRFRDFNGLPGVPPSEYDRIYRDWETDRKSVV